MARQESPYPTELELEILKVLWEESPLPVREVRSRLEASADRPLAHSSVITMLNIMHRKGFLTRRKSGKAFFFSPKVKKENVTGKMMGDLLSRVFEGDPAAAVQQLLAASDWDSKTIAQLRTVIAEAESRTDSGEEKAL